MISLTTGTNVPRRVNSTNSSYVVCFMAHGSSFNMCRPAFGILHLAFGMCDASSAATTGRRGRFSKQARGRPLAGPDLELAFRLRDEHRKSADDAAAGVRRGAHQ